VANINVESKEFHEMSLEIFRSGLNKGIVLDVSKYGREFQQTMKSFTREKFSELKKELAEEKRLSLCKSLEGSIWNIIVDVGTYGGKSKLSCKVGRPHESKNKRLRSRSNVDGLEGKYHHIVPLLVGNVKGVNRKDSKIKIGNSLKDNYDVKYYNQEIEWATPCSYMVSVEMRIRAKVLAGEKANSKGYCGGVDCPFSDDGSPFLLRSYPNVKNAEQYMDAFLDAIKIVKSFGGEVGSITVDYLPVQQMVLMAGGPLHQALKSLGSLGTFNKEGKDDNVVDERLADNVRNYLSADSCDAMVNVNNDEKEFEKENVKKLKLVSVDVDSLPHELLYTPC
jgi:hypothetical protein